MAGVQATKYKGERLRALLEVYRRFAAKRREDPVVARQKQQNYARKIEAGESVDYSQVKAIVDKLGIREYAVVGGQASIKYGARRATVDVDILASRDTVEEVLRSFDAKPEPMTIGGYTVVVNDIDVDLLHWHDPVWLEPLLNEALTDRGIRVVSPPWLLFLKFLASRDIDIADIQAVLRLMSEEDVRKTRRILKKYAPSELDDFESLVAIERVIKQESGAPPEEDE